MMLCNFVYRYMETFASFNGKIVNVHFLKFSMSYLRQVKFTQLSARDTSWGSFLNRKNDSCIYCTRQMYLDKPGMAWVCVLIKDLKNSKAASILFHSARKTQRGPNWQAGSPLGRACGALNGETFRDFLTGSNATIWPTKNIRKF